MGMTWGLHFPASNYCISLKYKHRDMATIRFFLKAIPTLNNGDLTSVPQTVLFRYRPNANFDLTLATPFKINPLNWIASDQQWDEEQITTSARLQVKKLLNDQIRKFNSDLSFFRKTVCDFIDTISDNDANMQREKIKDFVLTKYFANKIKVEKTFNPKLIPNKFSELIDFYIQQRSFGDVTEGTKPLAYNTVKKYNTLKNVLMSFNSKLHATEINDVWRVEFAIWLTSKRYSENTQTKFIKDIKMLCKYAYKDHNISKQVLSWKIINDPKNVSEYIAFSPEQLERLRTAIMPSERLDNARDFLLISSFSSVRISELFTMKKDKVFNIGEDYYIDVIEKKNLNKTGGKKIVYLLPQVIAILNKRNGEFPRKISEQKYNEYIKEVCEIAGFTEVIEWGKVEVTKSGKRKVICKEPFYKFISSHSGRATYISIFNDRIPTEIIQIQTNHHSLEMVEHYDKTDERDKMIQRAKAVADAHRNLDEYQPVKLKAV